MTDIRNNPHFVLFPLNNARTGYQPFAIPVLYVEPRRIDSNGNGIADSAALNVRYYVVDAPDPARVNGPFNQNVRIPDESLFEIELTQIDLSTRMLDLRSLLFFNSAGNPISFSDAVEGDTFEYTMRGNIVGSAPTSTAIYYPDAYYYDVSDITINVDDLPKPKQYFFIWESVFFRRISTASDQLKCISSSQGIAQEILSVNHPGDVHEYMVNSTPNLYFDFAGDTVQNDPTLQFYRPFADILQDIFDEQGFLDGINQLDTIPAEYIPYLAYLIGWDLPNYPGATDTLKRSILRRGSELQKLKSSKRVLKELFEMFGFVVDIINLQASLSGNELLGPGSGLETELLTQTDLVLSDYKAQGFGVGTVPFVYRPRRDSQVVLYAWLVQDGSDKYNELLALSNELSDDLEYANVEGLSFNINGVLEPSFVQQIGTSTTDGIIGYSTVVVSQGSSSNGRPVLNHKNISYDQTENIMNLFFDHELSVDANTKVFTFAVYERLKVIIPPELSGTRTNKFDIEFIDQQGLVVDFNLLNFLLDFVFNLKSFHSLLRKISIPIRVADVYNVTDMCIDGNDPFKPGTCLGDLQTSPAIIPNELTECQSDDDLGYKPTDLILKQLILDGLEEEFQAWKALAPDCALTPDGQDKVLDTDGVADTIEDAGTEDVSEYCSPDYDHREDDRPTLCEPDQTNPDYCYKGRVNQLLEAIITIPNKEHYSCNPCGPSLGDVVYWEQNNKRKITNKTGKTSLHYTDSSYFSLELLNPVATLATNPTSIVIEKDNLGFPSHRFLTMDKLENDYDYTDAGLDVSCYDSESVYKRPWDDVAVCGIFDTLNAKLVNLTNGDQQLVWDEEKLIYIGNGFEPDIPSLSDHGGITDDGCIITHKVYQYADPSHPSLTFDSTVFTDIEEIDTSSTLTGPIFSSVCEQNGEDFRGGYPAVTGFSPAIRDTFEDGDTSGNVFLFCSDSANPTCDYGNLDRPALADALCIASPAATDVTEAKYFGNSMKYIGPENAEYKYYEPYRLDCACLNEYCEDITSPTNPVQDVACNASALFDDQGNLDPGCDKITIDLAIALKESFTLCDRLTDFDLPNLFCLNQECIIPPSGQFVYKDDYGIIYETEWVISEDTMDIIVVTKDPRIPGEEPEGFVEFVDGSVKIFRKGVISTVRQIIKVVGDQVILEAEGTEVEVGYFQTNVACGQAAFAEPFAYGPDCALQADVAMLTVDGPHWVSPTEDVTDITFGFSAALVDEAADSTTIYKWTNPLDIETDNDLVWNDPMSVIIPSGSESTSSGDDSSTSTSSTSGDDSSSSSDDSSNSTSGSTSSSSDVSSLSTSDSSGSTSSLSTSDSSGSTSSTSSTSGLSESTSSSLSTSDSSDSSGSTSSSSDISSLSTSVSSGSTSSSSDVSSLSTSVSSGSTSSSSSTPSTQSDDPSSSSSSNTPSSVSSSSNVPIMDLLLLDAEQSDFIDDWTETTGGMDRFLYTTFPVADIPDDIKGLYYANGGTNASTVASRIIPLDEIISTVEAGNATYTFSGYIGGYSDSNDRAQALLEWYNDEDHLEGSVLLGPVTDTERADVTSFIFKTASDVIPVTATYGVVTLTFTREGAGPVLDGYIDVLRLKIPDDGLSSSSSNTESSSSVSRSFSSSSNTISSTSSSSSSNTISSLSSISDSNSSSSLSSLKSESTSTSSNTVSSSTSSQSDESSSSSSHTRSTSSSYSTSSESTVINLSSQSSSTSSGDPSSSSSSPSSGSFSSGDSSSSTSSENDLGEISTISTIDKSNNMILSNNNLTYRTTTAYASGLSTGIYTTGRKEYWVYNDNSNRMMAGIAKIDPTLTNYPGFDSNAIAVWADDGRVYNGGGTSQYLGTIPDGSYFGIRHEADEGKVWFKREEDENWTLSETVMPTGNAYRAIFGTGTSGSSTDTVNVIFNSDDFPETIGGDYEEIREPVLESYTRIDNLNRQDSSVILGPKWLHYGWSAAADRTSFCRDGFSSGKYEYWVLRPTSDSSTARAMAGWANLNHPLTDFPGEDDNGVSTWFSTGNLYSGGAVGPAIGTITHHLGLRIDIDNQTVEFNNNGTGWTSPNTVDSDLWNNGPIYPIYGHDADTNVELENFIELIFDPADFPQPISIGYDGIPAIPFDDSSSSSSSSNTPSSLSSQQSDSSVSTQSESSPALEVINSYAMNSTGTIETDITGGQNGLKVGTFTTVTGGTTDNALVFAGSQYIVLNNILDNPSGLFDNPYLESGEMWVSIIFSTTSDDKSTIGNILFSIHDDGGGNLVRMGTGPNGGLYARTGGGSDLEYSTDWDLNDGEWHHVVLRLDSNRAYGDRFNGVGSAEYISISGSPISPSTAYDMTNRISVAQEWDGDSPSDLFEGNIDSVVIANYYGHTNDANAIMDDFYAMHLNANPERSSDSTESSSSSSGSIDVEYILLYDGDNVKADEWTWTTGTFTDVDTNSVPDDRPGVFDNSNYLLGGNFSTSELNREVAISTDNVPFNLSAWMGGFESENDRATIELHWLNDSDDILEVEVLPPVTNSDRGNETGFILRESFGIIPTGTTKAIAYITLTKDSGSTTDAYIDGLLLKINETADISNTLLYDGTIVTIADEWTVTDGSYTENASQANPGDRDFVYSNTSYSYAGSNLYSETYRDIDVPSGYTDVIISAWLGGFSSGNDQPDAYIEFYNNDYPDLVLGSIHLGPHTPAERGNVTGFVMRQRGIKVPSGADYVRAYMSCQRGSGTSNDGYVDGFQIRYKNDSEWPNPVEFPNSSSSSSNTPSSTSSSSNTPSTSSSSNTPSSDSSISSSSSSNTPSSTSSSSSGSSSSSSNTPSSQSSSSDSSSSSSNTPSSQSTSSSSNTPSTSSSSSNTPSTSSSSSDSNSSSSSS